MFLTTIILAISAEIENIDNIGKCQNQVGDICTQNYYFGHQMKFIRKQTRDFFENDKKTYESVT